MDRENAVCLSIVLSVFFMSSTPFLLGAGLFSLAKGRNVGGIGTIDSFDLSTYLSCRANIHFDHQDKHVATDIFIPCDVIDRNQTASFIHICFNDRHPENVAYYDQGQHDYGDFASNPYDFCSDVGHGSAVAMLWACCILTALTASMWLILACFFCAPKAFTRLMVSYHKNITSYDPVKTTEMNVI